MKMKSENYQAALYDLVDKISRQPLGALTEGFDMVEHLRQILHQILPDDAHQKANGKLFVCCTQLVPVDQYAPLTVHDVEQGTSSSRFSKGPKRFQVGKYCWELGEQLIFSNFGDKNELIEILLGCACVPWFEVCKPPSSNGKYLVDGSLSQKDNLPEEVQFPFPPGRLIRISPDPKNHNKMRDKIATGWMDTSGQRFDISPLNMFQVGKGLFGPPKGHLEAFYINGYEEAIRFLKFYHTYEDSQQGLPPRKRQYAAIHSVEDLAP
ncbi:patatin-like phospholipase domain-containing protein 4 isoform X2 [Ptychodera flava]|uniref:patatin-like phospholipase domain-containing protein 4 isoform X2 n=1 Tax=Ptychodera flava TaxID=63121 RepID=UPI00396A4DF0